MKIFLLISGLFFSGGVLADMDSVCFISPDKHLSADVLIADKCERNNILTVIGINSRYANLFVSRYCRQDREITLIDDGNNLTNLTCVLYSNLPRKIIEH